MDTETTGTREQVVSRALRSIGFALITGATLAALTALIALGAGEPVIAAFAPMVFAIGAGVVLAGNGN